MISFILRHPSRLGWMIAEFLRPLPCRRRFANAWWQLRWYGREDKFFEVIEQHREEWDAAVARASTKEEFGAAVEPS